MILSSCIDEILLLGLDDWIQASEIASVARTVGGARSENQVRALSIEIIRAVVQGGLMKAGNVTQDGFREWGQSPNDAVERIAGQWAALGRGPDLGEICWLSNTEEGDRRARRLENGEAIR